MQKNPKKFIQRFALWTIMNYSNDFRYEIDKKQGQKLKTFILTRTTMIALPWNFLPLLRQGWIEIAEK
jgi:hypothetical protein